MAYRQVAQRLQSSILFYSAITTLVIGGVLGVVALLPLYQHLQRSQRQDLIVALQHKIYAVDAFLSHAQDVTWQIATRTTLRKTLTRYNQGQISRQQLEAISTPILLDAKRQTTSIVAIRQLDAQDQAVIHVGPPLATDLPMPPPSWQAIIYPQIISLADQQRCFVIATPILSPDNQRIGTDIVFFQANQLQQRIAQTSTYADEQASLLASMHQGQIQFLAAVAHHAIADSPSGLILSPETEVYRQMSENAAKQAITKDIGLRFHPPEAPGKVLAYGPIPNSQLGLILIEREQDFYQPIYRQLGVIGGAILAILALSSGSMVLLLRSLTGKWRVLTSGLEDIITAKTQDLQAELNRREQTEQELEKARQDLEQRVQTRTTELSLANQQLQQEVENRQVLLQQQETITAALETSEAKYSTLLNDVLDTSAVGKFVLDAQFRIVWVNQTLTTFLGINREELLGQDHRQFLTEYLQHCFAAGRDFIQSILESYQQQNYLQPVECRVLPRGDRQERWLEHWSQPIQSGLYAGGRIEYFTDITRRFKTEKALRDSEERWQLIQQGSNDALWDWDVTHQQVFLSDRWQEMRGYSPSQIEQLRQQTNRLDVWSSEIHPDDRSFVQTTLQQYFERQIPTFAIEYRVRHRLGHYFWILDRGQAIWDDQGKVTRMVGIETNITGRKEAEAALKQSEANFAEAQRLAQIGNWEWNIQTNELSCSEELFHIFGMEYLGKKSHLEIFFDKIHPQDQPRVQQALNAALYQGKPYDIDYRISLSDDQLRYVHAQGEVIFDPSHHPVGMFGTVQDTTEQKQSELALQYQLKLEKLLAELSNHFVKIASEELAGELQLALQTLGEFLQGDRLQIWLLSTPAALNCDLPSALEDPGDISQDPEESVVVQLHQQWTRPQTTCQNLIPSSLILDEALPWLYQRLQNLTSVALSTLTELPANAEAERNYLSQQGVCSTLIVPMVYGRALVGYLRLDLCEQIRHWDISHLQLMQLVGEILVNALERSRNQQELAKRAQELERSNQELEQFAYVASHDLQEPLRSVISYTELLEEEYGGQLSTEADEYIHFIIDGGTRMKQLIQDLLAFSRVDRRGKAFTSVSVTAAVEQALANLAVTLQENQAQVDYGPLPTLEADASQLVQLFQNLISNAIKFRTSAPPQIQIQAQPKLGSHQSAYWKFSLRDNGIGIDPQFTKRIFDVFQRLHTRREYPGTGIGLAICRKIVERHGGQIWVESCLGQGATFYFTIKDNRTIKDNQPSSWER